ncbi:DUF6776 family protein [Nitrosovibrio tenuis]|uniref:Uncharacterized protein n=1 Tax=Nitrosovibrio tenuis TaxID=1233 RepID=A0A1H7NAA6_9PROT|nr:DUF6776 family protein [Nitrosovibrio tenuis]SEL20410.1 hypothetical protein SAMN05216387_106108 [Nitrosovibrio tenuis]
MMKSLKRKFGISASRVAVRPQIPAYVRWLAITVLVALAMVLSWSMYDAGRKFAGFDKNEISYELERLSQLNTRLQRDNDELRMKVASVDRQLQMDHVVREDITKQVKALETENIRLKEDLAFFQNLGSVPGKTEQRVSIGRLKLERGQLPGEYHYSLLLVQGGQRQKDFQGSLEFTINFQQNEKKLTMPLASESPSKLFDVRFKFYQRVERSFRMPSDATVESMQVKVFENGIAQARLMQTVNLSL